MKKSIKSGIFTMLACLAICMCGTASAHPPTKAPPGKATISVSDYTNVFDVLASCQVAYEFTAMFAGNVYIVGSPVIKHDASAFATATISYNPSALPKAPPLRSAYRWCSLGSDMFIYACERTCYKPLKYSSGSGDRSKYLYWKAHANWFSKSC